MKSKMIRLCGLVASALLFVAVAPAGRADEPAAKYSLSIVHHGKGSVSGGGSFAAGRKLTLKATASRGYVFAGWYSDAEFTTPLELGVDYRKTSVSYTVAEDASVYARFIPVKEDKATVSAEVAPEYETGAEIEPITLAVGGESLPSAAVTGLPSGLKFTAKALTIAAKGTTPEKSYAANTIYGVPKKSGIYTATATVTTAGKAKATANLRFVVQSPGEVVLNVFSTTKGCKASGTGVYAPGKVLTLKATAAKGYVFAGWYSDAEFTTPLELGVDYRKTSVSYTVAEDASVYARFIPVKEDKATVSAEVAPEYETGAEIEPITLAVGGESLPSAAVTGLPSGLKFTAKALTIAAKGTTPEKSYAANTIYGVPKKSGIYTATATVTTAGKAKATANLRFVVQSPGEVVLNVFSTTKGCKASGTGVYAPGKVLTLKATAAKGYVFAGWYSDEEFTTPLELKSDYRKTSVSYTVAEDASVYARFLKSKEDTLSVSVSGTYSYAGVVGLSLGIESGSLPKVTLSNLPAGLKLDAATLTVQKGSDKIPAPGSYVVTVKATNSTVTKAKNAKFTVTVPNFTDANGYFESPIANGEGERYVTTVGVAGGGLPSLKLTNESLTLKVSGLPSGMSYNAAQGSISGAATKTGTYTVTLSVDGKASTFTLVVEPIPAWLASSFGFELAVGDSSGATNRVTWQEMTVTSAGKVSGKGRCFALTNSTDWTESWLGSWSGRIVERKEEDDVTKFVIERTVSRGSGEEKRTYRLRLTAEPVEVGGATVGTLTGGFEGAEEDGIFAIQVERGAARGGAATWSGATKGTSAAPVFAKAYETSLDLMSPQAWVWDDAGREFEYEGTLHLRFETSGAVQYRYGSPTGALSPVGSAAPVLVENRAEFGSDDSVTFWRFAATCAPAGRAPFIAVVEMSVANATAALTAEELSLRVTEVCARAYDPYCGWASGEFYGYHLLSNFENGGDSGYYRLVRAVIGEDGGMSLYETGLAGTEKISQFYQTEDGERDGRNKSFGAWFSRSKTSFGTVNVGSGRVWEELELAAERMDLGGLDLAVVDGEGSGVAENGRSFDSALHLVKSAWGDKSAAGVLPVFSGTNTSVTCVLQLADPSTDVGYSNVTATVTFGTNNTVDVRYFPLAPGELYVDDAKGGKTRVSPLKYCSAKLVPYRREGGAVSAFVTVSGAVKGKDSHRNEHGAFFSAVIDFTIPVDEAGNASADTVTYSLPAPPIVFPAATEGN